MEQSSTEPATRGDQNKMILQSGVDPPLKYINKTATLFRNMSKIAEGELYKDIQEDKK